MVKCNNCLRQKLKWLCVKGQFALCNNYISSFPGRWFMGVSAKCNWFGFSFFCSWVIFKGICVHCLLLINEYFFKLVYHQTEARSARQESCWVPCYVSLPPHHTNPFHSHLFVITSLQKGEPNTRQIRHHSKGTWYEQTFKCTQIHN